MAPRHVVQFWHGADAGVSGTAAETAGSKTVGSAGAASGASRASVIPSVGAATWAPRHPSEDPRVARSGAKSTVSRALAARSLAAARSRFAAACMPSRWARSRFFSLRAALRASRSGAALLMNW